MNKIRISLVAVALMFTALNGTEITTKEPMKVEKSQGWVKAPASTVGNTCTVLEYGRDAKYAFSTAKPASKIKGSVFDKGVIHCYPLGATMWVKTGNAELTITSHLYGGV